MARDGSLMPAEDRFVVQFREKGKPGKFQPLGQEPMPLDLAMTVANELKRQKKGSVSVRVVSTAGIVIGQESRTRYKAHSHK